MDRRALRELELDQVAAWMHVSVSSRAAVASAAAVASPPVAPVQPAQPDLRVLVADCGPASWLFLGQAEPNHDADRAGPAARLLVGMLAAVGCKPRGEPLAADGLDRQIELARPKLIVALGRTAATHLLGEDRALAQLRGRLHRRGEVPVVVTFHPADLLANPADKAKAWEDLVFARRSVAAA